MSNSVPKAVGAAAQSVFIPGAALRSWLSRVFSDPPPVLLEPGILLSGSLAVGLLVSISAIYVAIAFVVPVVPAATPVEARRRLDCRAWRAGRAATPLSN